MIWFAFWPSFGLLRLLGRIKCFQFYSLRTGKVLESYAPNQSHRPGYRILESCCDAMPQKLAADGNQETELIEVSPLMPRRTLTPKAGTNMAQGFIFVQDLVRCTTGQIRELPIPKVNQKHSNQRMRGIAQIGARRKHFRGNKLIVASERRKAGCTLGRFRGKLPGFIWDSRRPCWLAAN